MLSTFFDYRSFVSLILCSVSIRVPCEDDVYGSTALSILGMNIPYPNIESRFDISLYTCLGYHLTHLIHIEIYVVVSR